MKNFLVLLFITCVFSSSCMKTTEFNYEKQAAVDDSLIKEYITKNKISAVKDSSQLYYQVITPGSGDAPTLNSNVVVNYKGKLINGSPFDQGNNISFKLGDVIEGWQTGLQYIRPGGKIMLILPSALAYANNSPTSAIPANSVLIFEVELIGYK